MQNNSVTYIFIGKCCFEFRKLDITIFAADIFEICREPANHFAVFLLSMPSVVTKENCKIVLMRNG